MIYLDNNASTIVDPEIAELITLCNSQYYGNPNSAHDFGKKSHPMLTEASDRLYYHLNMDMRDTLLITSCATESISSVHHSVLTDYLKTPSAKNRIISSPIEHPAVLQSLEALEDFGIEIVYLPVRDYSYTAEDFAELFDPDKTLLISLSLANSETGIIHPLKDITALSGDTLVHSDITQAVGKIPVDTEDLGADYYSFSGHKFHAPKGVGGLIIKNKAPFNPLLHGANSYRAGTMNTAGAVAMGAALHKAVKTPSDIPTLKKRLEDFLSEIEGCNIFGYDKDRLPNTVYFNIQGIDSDYIVWYLNKQNIYVSSGSACKSQSSGQNGVRISLSRFTSEAEIDTLINALKELIKNKKAKPTL